MLNSLCHSWWIWNVRLKWNAFLKLELFSSGGFHLWRSMGGIKIHGAIHGSALIIELPEGLAGCFPGDSPSVYTVQLLSASHDMIVSYAPWVRLLVAEPSHHLYSSLAAQVVWFVSVNSPQFRLVTIPNQLAVENEIYLVNLVGLMARKGHFWTWS